MPRSGPGEVGSARGAPAPAGRRQWLLLPLLRRLPLPERRAPHPRHPGGGGRQREAGGEEQRPRRGAGLQRDPLRRLQHRRVRRGAAPGRRAGPARLRHGHGRGHRAGDRLGVTRHPGRPLLPARPQSAAPSQRGPGQPALRPRAAPRHPQGAPGGHPDRRLPGPPPPSRRLRHGRGGVRLHRAQRAQLDDSGSAPARSTRNGRAPRKAPRPRRTRGRAPSARRSRRTTTPSKPSGGSPPTWKPCWTKISWEARGAGGAGASEGGGRIP